MALSPKPKLMVLVTLAERGGAQTYLAELLPALGGFDVVLASSGRGPLRDATLAAGARYVELQHMRRDLEPREDVLALRELIGLMRRERPHIVHCNSSKAGVLGRIAAAATRVPVRIFTVHGWAHAAYSGRAGALYRWADRLMAPLTSLTICVAERELTTGLAARTCRARSTVVVPNAVDVAGTPRARPDRARDVLVAVGRLKGPKDPLTLVRATARMQVPASVLLVGDGPDHDEVAAEVAALGLERRVTLTGDRSDVPELLAGSAAFVLSSRSEGAPMSVLEAMAAGLPVVASAVGGVPELVRDGVTGLLVPAGDPDALAAALDRVLGEPGLADRLGDAGRARALERFDIAANRRAHVELYARELARRGLPTPAPMP